MADEKTSAVQELSEETFNARTAETPACVVDFYATWCPHCRAFRPVYEEVAGACDTPVTFYAADVEKCEEAAGRFNVRSIPTVVILKDGQPVDTHIGAMTPEALREWVATKCEV
ncbi:MAG TPA: thioredoxin family protein [Armatimonadota bacterium]